MSTTTDAIKELLAEERARTRAQERRVRAYAQVLTLFAHRLAIAEGKIPVFVMRQATAEVQARLQDPEWF